MDFSQMTDGDTESKLRRAIFELECENDQLQETVTILQNTVLELQEVQS